MNELNGFLIGVGIVIFGALIIRYVIDKVDNWRHK